MTSRIEPVKPQDVSGPGVKQRMTETKDGWWKDTEMFGAIGRVPSLLNSLVPVFEAFFGGGRSGQSPTESVRACTRKSRTNRAEF